MQDPVICDLHCHLLPGIDDGARDVAQSLRMYQVLKNTGWSTVWATPHFYSDRTTLQDFLDARAYAYETFCRSFPSPPSVWLGAEVYYFKGVSRSSAAEKLALQHTPYLLLELPFEPLTSAVLREVQQFSESCGLIPILAHLERYLRFIPFSSLLQLLDCSELLVQINISSLSSLQTLPFFERRKFLKLLHFAPALVLGSDLHTETGLSAGRPVKLLEQYGLLAKVLSSQPGTS